MDRYKKERADIKTAAEKLEADATSWDKQARPIKLHERQRSLPIFCKQSLELGWNVTQLFTESPPLRLGS